jgi:hypothetical protein
LPVKQGNAFELHRLQHFTSPAPEPSISLVVDVCGTSLVDATTYMEGAFESGAFAAAPAPKRLCGGVYEPPPLKKRFAFLEQKPSLPDTVNGHHFQGMLDLIEVAGAH